MQANKICDPVHGFVRFNEIERAVIDSIPFQRLRYLRQMGVVYLLYPGANHSRFEHSLGVMELASRIFDTITYPSNLIDKKMIPSDQNELDYYRQILRLAALCHDMGHLPFSHTAEKALLPLGGHERKTLTMIQSDSMRRIWEKISGKNVENDIIKLAIKDHQLPLSPWERVLSQVITEDNFGADRIDYLLRDAYYTGVGYGHFDFKQMIDTLRILPDRNQLTIGVAESGIQSVESLWIARYLMYARVYHHPTSRIYTHHMSRLMTLYYNHHGFPATPEGYLRQIDATILNFLLKAADDPISYAYVDALALLNRSPTYKMVEYEKIPDLDELLRKFNGFVFIDQVDDIEKERPPFLVLKEKGTIIPSYEESLFLRVIPHGGKKLRLYGAPDRVEALRKCVGSYH
ncbi:MAG: HD domain-containing protein [Chlamydiia bacterium]|nr:HD domain-containing protein [Chlamydiia bacterium]